MFPHGWLKPEVVGDYEEKLRNGQQPTAVGIGILDVRSPVVLRGPVTAITEHWCFPSFLIDGHHKAYAAATQGRELTLLTFLAQSESAALPAQITELLNLL